MRFLSIVSLIEFTKIMEELEYTPSITINELKQAIKKLPRYISQYVAKLMYLNNVVVLYLIEGDNVRFEVVYEKKKV